MIKMNKRGATFNDFDLDMCCQGHDDSE